MRNIKKGSTDQSVVIRIVDSADGTPETGVVYNTSGIDLWYRREGAVKTSITEATLSALNDAHADGGILHIGDGYYRLDLPDAAFATGADGVAVGGTVTGMVVIGCYVPLVAFDPQDDDSLGLSFVKFGYTFIDAIAQGLLSSGGYEYAQTGATGRQLVSATSTTATLHTIENNGADDCLKNYTLRITSSTGVDQIRTVVSNVVSTRVVTVDRAWDVTPDNTSGYELICTASASGSSGGGLDAAGVRAAIGMSSANLDTQLSTIDTVVDGIKAKTDSLTFTVSNVLDANTLRVGGTTQTARDLGASVLLSNGTGTGQVSLSSGLVTLAGTQTFSNTGTWTGNIVGTLSTLTTYTGNTPQTGDSFARLGAPSGASIAADIAAIEAGSGLDAAETRAALGLASANLDTQLSTIDTVVDLIVIDSAAIKTKTDFLPSATAGAVGGLFIAGSNAATTVATWTCTGAALYSSTFTIAGATALQSTLTVTGATTFTGAVSLSSTLGITGAITASSASNNITGIDVAKISGDATAAETLELFAEALDQVTGQLDSGSFAAGAITASTIATGAIDADALATDAVTEIVTANWASTTDGIANNQWLRLTGQFLFGVTTISGASRITKARDGTTTILTAVKGATAGSIDTSTIV